MLIERRGRRMVAGITLAVALAISWANLASAQNNPFAPGWDLDAAASNLRFQSIKNTTKVESSSFASFVGSIEPDGAATVKILMELVDTKIDLRNVRMRFLFFETFKFPEATVRLQLAPEMVADLAESGRKTVTVPYTLDLHGVELPLETEVTVTLLSANRVSVASAAPISIGVDAFGLTENLGKLEEAAGVTILPSATVTFDFLFDRRGGGAVQTVAAATPAPASAALEAAGDFSLEACVGRFEILSRTGNIYFRTASARLSDESYALLKSVVDIVRRCPGLRVEVAGHTDSDGGELTNQRLSEARAAAVAGYLVENGIEADRIVSVGYGENRPVVANDSPVNKSRNRRIEFAAIAE